MGQHMSSMCETRTQSLIHCAHEVWPEDYHNNDRKPSRDFDSELGTLAPVLVPSLT